MTHMNRLAWLGAMLLLAVPPLTVGCSEPETTHARATFRHGYEMGREDTCASHSASRASFRSSLSFGATVPIKIAS